MAFCSFRIPASGKLLCLAATFAVGFGCFLVAGAAQADLVLYYPLDERQGSVIGNAGTLGDGVLNNVDNVGEGWTTEGAPGGFTPGGAIVFNGLNSGSRGTHIATGLSADALGINGANNYTTSAWFKLSALGNGDNLDSMIFGQAATATLLHNGLRGDKMHMGHWGNDVTGNQVIATETWVHGTWRYKNGRQAIFIDGVVDVAANRGPLNNPANVIIGDTHTGQDRAFTGTLDEIVIYNEALAVNQIQHLAGGGDPNALPLAQSLSVEGRLVINGAGKVSGAAYEGINGVAGGDVTWKAQLFRTNVPPNPSQLVTGLRTEIFKGPNNNSAALWATFLAGNPTPSEPAFNAPNINWADSGGGVGNVGYYAGFNAASANIDNYSVRMTGEIFIPKPGMYKFKDGNDDYTSLTINGVNLIDDNDWAGTDGTRVNGGVLEGTPIVTADFTGIAAGGEWLDIEFLMAEGGGGDRGTLYWDYDSGTGTVGGNAAFPAANTDAAGAGALISSDFFRSGFTGGTVLAGEISGTSVIGDRRTDAVFMDDMGGMLTVPAGQTGFVRLMIDPKGAEAGVMLEAEFVPEPSSWLILALGLSGLAVVSRRKRGRSAA